MNEFVLYFTNSQIEGKSGLVFPSEIEDDNYYGIGSFYLQAENEVDLKEKYSIHAVRNEDIIIVDLQRSVNSKNFYTGFVNEIGTFTFFAEKLATAKVYVGSTNEYQDTNFQYRLRLFNIQKAEKAVTEYDFYFIGSSNIINI
jgi:hypothetical protein